MKRTFCDVCNFEITSHNEAFNGKKTITVDVRKEGNGPVITKLNIEQNTLMYNADVCKGCMIDAINRLDDRTKITGE